MKSVSPKANDKIITVQSITYKAEESWRFPGGPNQDGIIRGVSETIGQITAS
jgi:hypothetical protein